LAEPTPIRRRARRSRKPPGSTPMPVRNGSSSRRSWVTLGGRDCWTSGCCRRSPARTP